MEVHHHPHVEKKGIKEYFLEFLMIFLAVTLGFMAENLREHITVKNKEKNYMVSMLEDLGKDTVRLEDLINTKLSLQFEWLDSSINLLESQDMKGKERLLYQSAVNATWWINDFQPTRRTLDQLKIDGYRVISNTKVSNAIAEFSNFLEYNDEIFYDAVNCQNSIDSAGTSILDYKILKQLWLKNNDENRYLSLEDIPSNITILNFNLYHAAIYANKLKQGSLKLTGLLIEYKILLKRETNLLELIKKEYNL